MRKLRVAVAIAILGLWAYGTWVLWITARLMSLDEEWQGWGDVVLNPYNAGAYVMFSAVLFVPAVLLLRHRRDFRS